MNESKNNYNVNSLVYLIMFAISSGLGVIFIPVLTFYLTPEYMGMYSIVNNVILVLTGLFNYALISNVLRFYPEYQLGNKSNQFYGAMIIIVLLVILFILLVVYGTLFFIKDELPETARSLLAFSGFIVVFMIVWKVHLTMFQAQENARLYALINSGEVVFRYIFAILLLFFGLDIFAPFLAMLVSSVVAGGTILFYFYKMAVFDKGYFVSVFKSVSKYGYPLVFASFSMWLLSSSDVFMLAHLTDNEQVGLYTVGYAIPFQSITLVTMAILTTMEPALVKCWEEKGKKETSELISYFAKQLVVLSVPVIVGGTFLSKLILRVFTDNAYLETHKIFIFIALGAFFWAMYKIAYAGLYLEKKTIKIAVLLAVCGCLNVLLNLIVIPEWVYLGAAMTTMFSYFLLFILANLFSKKYITWEIPYKLILKAIFSSFIMVIAMTLIEFFIKTEILLLIVKFLSGVFVYMVIMYFLNTFDYIPFGNKIIRTIKRKHSPSEV